MNRFRFKPVLFAAIVAIVVLMQTRRGIQGVEERKPLIQELDATSVHAYTTAPFPKFRFAASSYGERSLTPASSGAPPRSVAVHDDSREERKKGFGGSAFLARDMDRGEDVLTFRSDRRWPMASLAKLMTAVVAEELFPPEAEITMRNEAIQMEGQAGDFREGERYAARDLINAALVVSSNDAAYALASAYGREEFLAALNAKAKFLGMEETFFADESGLSPFTQSTAEDLAKLAAYLLRQRAPLLAVTRAREVEIIERGTGVSRTLRNINQFAGEAEFIGGKTGFTEEAKENLLSLFEIRGRRVLVVVFGTENRFLETQKIYDYLARSTAGG